METLVDYFNHIPSAHRSAFLLGGLSFFMLLEYGLPFYRNKYNKTKHLGVNLFFTGTTIVINFLMAFILLKSSDWAIAHGFGILNWLPQMPLAFFVVLGLLLLDLIGAGWTAAGEAAGSDWRGRKAGRERDCDGVRRDARAGSGTRGAGNREEIWAAECASELRRSAARFDRGGHQREGMGPGHDGQCEGAVPDVAGGTAGISKGGRRSDREYRLGAGADRDEGSRGILRVERRGDDADEGHGDRSRARECAGELHLPVNRGDGTGERALRRK